MAMSPRIEVPVFDNGNKIPSRTAYTKVPCQDELTKLIQEFAGLGPNSLGLEHIDPEVKEYLSDLCIKLTNELYAYETKVNLQMHELLKTVLTQKDIIAELKKKVAVTAP